MNAGKIRSLNYQGQTLNFRTPVKKVLKTYTDPNTKSSFVLAAMDKGTMGLHKLFSEDKGDIFELVSTKARCKGAIKRRQFNPETQELIGSSSVRPSTKYSSGQIIVNDETISMNEPFHYLNGKVSKYDTTLTRNEVTFWDAENPSPLSRRFIKMLLKTLNIGKARH